LFTLIKKFYELHRTKLLIAFFIGLGIISNFGKELSLSYFYGAQKIVDSYRIATFLPYILFQSMGTILSGIYLPNVIGKKPEEYTFYITIASILVALLGILLSPIYIKYFAIGYKEIDLIYLSIKTSYCWCVFFLGSLIFHIRIILLSNRNSIAVSSISFINAITFLILLTILCALYGVKELWLYISFGAGMLSIVFVLAVVYHRQICLTSIFKAAISREKKSPVTGRLITVAILSNLIIALPRVVDRSYASTLKSGTISYIDYSYNIYIAFGLLLGTASVIYLSRFIAQNISNQNIIILIFMKSRIVLFFGIIVSLSIYLLPVHFTKILYLRGAFNLSDAISTAGFLKYIILSLPFMVFNMLILQLLLGYGSEIIILFVASLKLIVKILTLNYFFSISVFASIGVSNLISEIVFTLSALYLLRRIRQRTEKA
jgi:putative peptidoglycan lipid II flippase